MYLAGFGGSLREKMLRDAKSLKREALKPGGARAEVCVRLLNAESSSSQPEAVGPLALPVKTLLSRYQRVVHWTLAP